MQYMIKKKIKRYSCLCIAVIFLAVSVTGCSNKKETSDTVSLTDDSGQATEVQQTEVQQIEVQYKEEDTNSSWSMEDAVAITCEGTDITVNGAGASVKESKVTITKAGTYVISGSLSDGQIAVEAGKEDLVRLVLNGVSLNCKDSAAIYGVQSDKIVLILADGTENEITDGTEYVFDDADASEPNSAIFSKDDLTINGSGTLTVNGNYNHGIFSKDDLSIISGNIKVTSVNDGLKGKDSVTVLDGTISLETGGDGIQSNNNTDSGKGYIVLEGGNFTIHAGNDGIQAETILQVEGGSYHIVSGGGSANASTDAKGNERMEWGRWQKQEAAAAETPASNTEETTEETSSAKGIKAGSVLFVKAGTIDIDSSDDSLHSNGSVFIEGGELKFSSGDDGVHADAALNINGGTVIISESYEGLEGKSIDINGGTIYVTAKDDGLNAAGGNDGSSMNGRPGENSFAEEGDSYIRITDGYLYVDASGDGVDSNGRLYVDGGTTLVNGPENSGNGALDYNGTAEITGGTFVAAGSSGMAQAFSDTSTQNSLMVYYNSPQSAGTCINLNDSAGNTVFSFAPSKNYESVLISSPKLAANTTYILTSGGKTEGEVSDGYYEDGVNSSGTKLTEVTLSNIVTRISEDGSEVSGDMGGGMKGGGEMPKGQERPNRQPPQGAEQNPPDGMGTENRA